MRYFRFACSGEKIWRSSIRIHGNTAAPNLISNMVWYLTLCWHLFKEFPKYFYNNLKCQGQTHKERVLPAEVLDLMADFRDPYFFSLLHFWCYTDSLKTSAWMLNFIPKEVLCNPVSEKGFSSQLSFLEWFHKRLIPFDGKYNLFVFEGKFFCLHRF